MKVREPVDGSIARASRQLATARRGAPRKNPRGGQRGVGHRAARVDAKARRLATAAPSTRPECLEDATEPTQSPVVSRRLRAAPVELRSLACRDREERLPALSWKTGTSGLRSTARARCATPAAVSPASSRMPRLWKASAKSGLRAMARHRRQPHATGRCGEAPRRGSGGTRGVVRTEHTARSNQEAASLLRRIAARRARARRGADGTGERG